MRRLAILGLGILLLGATVATVASAQSTKPRIAVLEFKNKADNQWWYHGGAAAMQDVFVTELVKSGKFRVIDREQLAALMQEKNLSLAGDIDPATAIKAG
ncbi:MAG: CsgG/HfaB family protein, partial [Acidobacteriota bacterium]|nr:CsgG/HfaB family protein [Acidobacteriota bacterium]